MTPGDTLRSVAVAVPRGKATPLGRGRIVSVTIWNLTGHALGVGGPELECSDHLPPGDSFTAAVRSLAAVHVYQDAEDELLVHYTVTE